eukprot:228553_1
MASKNQTSRKRRALSENIHGAKKPKTRFESLLSAAKYGDLEDVKHFVSQDPTVVSSTDSEKRRNALHLAAINGHIDVIRYLLEETEIDVMSTDTETKNSLHLAAANGHLEIVRYFVNETDLDVVSVVEMHLFKGQNALHLAALGGHHEVVRYLVTQTEIDVHCRDRWGKNALLHAMRYDVEDTCNIVTVRYLLAETDIDVQCTDRDGRNALHWAAWNGYFECVAYLLKESKIDVNLLDRGGQSALYYAAYFRIKRLNIVPLLLKHP